MLVGYKGAAGPGAAVQLVGMQQALLVGAKHELTADGLEIVVGGQPVVEQTPG